MCVRVCVCVTISLLAELCCHVCVSVLQESARKEQAQLQSQLDMVSNERHVLTLKLQYEGPRTRVVYPKIKYSKLPKWGEICVG